MAVCLEVLDGGDEGDAGVLRQVLGVGGHRGEGEHGPALGVCREQHGGAGRVACRHRGEKRLGAPKPGTRKTFPGTENQALDKRVLREYRCMLVEESDPYKKNAGQFTWSGPRYAQDLCPSA